MSREREKLFDHPYYDQNIGRRSSIKFEQALFERDRFFTINFYMLPDEKKETMQTQLGNMTKNVLGNDFSKYALSYKTPWFEPAFCGPDIPLVRELSASIQRVTWNPPVITTLSKQDAFVLTNHAKIPTVSFGPGRLEGPCIYS